MEWLQYISPIIAAAGTIITAWFAYNQRTKDKMTDLKVERFRAQEKIRSKRRSDNSGIIIGELWSVLYELDADRVYIVQPHPLGNEEKLSIYYEVKRKGVEPMKPHIQSLPIAEVAKFNRMLVENLFMYFDNIDEQVGDKYAKAILSSYGCETVAIKRLSDNRNDRNGSIFCEFIRPVTVSQEEVKKVLHDAATNIQYILPEFEL